MRRRDHFDRMIRRRGAAWLPLDLPMTPPVLRRMRQRTGHERAVEGFDLDFDCVRASWPANPQAWRDALESLGWRWPGRCDISDFGFAHVHPPAESLGEADHLTELIHPLSIIERVEQLDALPWPDLSAAYGDDLTGQVQRLIAEDRVVVANMECTVFELAWYARGLDQLFMDLLEGNGIADWLLDWHTRRSCRQAEAFASAGVDVIGLGDDVGTQHGMMMAPDFWRQHLKPRLARVIQTIRRHQGQRRILVRYHSDGDIRDILDDLIEIGVDILNPLQPECMPVLDVIRRYGERLAFWGAIGTQTTMPFGTIEDVRAAVALLAEQAREGVAIVVAPTHVLEPDVPWENIVALVEAAKTALNPGRSHAVKGWL